MNDSMSISWKEFKENLLQHQHLDLQFQYAEGKWVSPSYHITEVKQAPITSVDCGGVKNEWTEVILQLMEPATQQQLRSMKAHKALSIINVVEKVLSLDNEAVVKIEFGNKNFDTRQLYPVQFITDGKNFIVDLLPGNVQCKAIERGGSCGTATNSEECCAPAKPKINLKDLSNTTACCTPGSGCC